MSTTDALSYRDLILFTVAKIRQIVGTPLGLKSCTFKVSTFGLGIKLQVDDQLMLIHPTRDEMSRNTLISEFTLPCQLMDFDGPIPESWPEASDLGVETES